MESIMKLNEQKKSSIVTLVMELFRMIIDYILVNNNVQGFVHLKETVLAIVYYVFDILYAKDFSSDNMKPKVKWIIASLSNIVFVKILLSFIVQVVMAHSLTRYIISVINKSNILKKFKSLKYFNLLVSSFVNLFLLGPLVFYLKFKWAYIIREKLDIVDIIIMTWVITLVTLYTVLQTTNNILHNRCKNNSSETK